MPVIAFSSPKGGAGKTTAATILATVLAERGASVAVIDADPNKNVVDWSHLPGKPASLTVIGEVGEETIVDAIEVGRGQGRVCDRRPRGRGQPPRQLRHRAR